MADFTSGMTGSSELDQNAVLAFTQAFVIESEQAQVLDDNIVQMQVEIDAKSFSFPRFDALAPVSTPLTAKEDPASTVLSDTEVSVTPKEFGNVITTTRLSNLESGGRTDVAAATLVGKNAGRSQDARAILTLDAGSQIITPDNVAAGSLTASNIADDQFLEAAYNKLARASVPAVGDAYVAVMHDDVISDIRSNATANGWVEVSKYSGSTEILRNEVGMYKGFRIVRQNDSSIEADGAGTVDIYNSYFVGFNAIAKGTSQEAQLTITGPFDKLGRFLNVGWYGVYDYALVEPKALIVGRSASTVGDNA